MEFLRIEFWREGVLDGGGRSGRGFEVGRSDLPRAGDAERGAVDEYLRSAAGTGYSRSHLRRRSSLAAACSPANLRSCVYIGAALLLGRSFQIWSTRLRWG